MRVLRLLARRGAGEQQHEIGIFGARGPDLLAVDDVAVAVADGGGAEAERVGARGRFGDAERLQPQFTPRDAGQVALFLFRLPWRSSVPIVYIWAWQAAPLQPEA